MASMHAVAVESPFRREIEGCLSRKHWSHPSESFLSLEFLYHEQLLRQCPWFVFRSFHTLSVPQQWQNLGALLLRPYSNMAVDQDEVQGTTYGLSSCVWIDMDLFNPLTTDDAFWRCQILAACYQLAQSVLKIGSALAERVGQGEVPLCLTVHGGGCSCL